MSSTEEIIGREDANDINAILAITNTEPDAVLHQVPDNADCLYTWDYNKGARPQLEKLYEKAKVGQWNGETDLPWDTVVDPEQEATEAYRNAGGMELLCGLLGKAPLFGLMTDEGRMSTWLTGARRSGSSSTVRARRGR